MLRPFKSTESRREYRLEIKKSIFLAESKMVESPEAALAFVEMIKNKHPKARHHCYAYSISVGGLKERANDDGEPSQTAGMPILKAINMNGIENCIIVVTRYFGGIKLGAGGLTRAYMSAATGVIEEAGITTFEEYRKIRVNLSYDLYDICDNFLRNEKIKVISSDFKEEVELVLVVESKKEDELILKMTELTNARISCNKLELFIGTGVEYV